MIGRLLCWLGRHRWQVWSAVRVDHPFGHSAMAGNPTMRVTDHCVRCQRKRESLMSLNQYGEHKKRLHAAYE
jgi:hypothetical protein